MDMRKWWWELRGALAFGTVLPVGRAASFSPERLPVLFPFVGLVLGVLIAVADAAAVRLWPAPTAAVIDAALLAVLTGALHLDGVADTADGIFSHRPRERALEIMKDSRVGSMGMVAVIVLLMLKTAGIYGLESHRGILLVLIPGYARCSVFFALRRLPYGRPEGGIVSGLGADAPPLRSHWGLGLLLLAALPLGWTGVGLAAGFAAVTAATIRFYRKTMACITGDMMGAMIETTETALFLVLSLHPLAGGA